MKKALDAEAELKLKVAKEALVEWDLVKHIDATKKTIDKFIAENVNKIAFVDKSNLEIFIRDVKRNVEVLIEKLSQK
jgi:hypothetical protein